MSTTLEREINCGDGLVFEEGRVLRRDDDGEPVDLPAGDPLRQPLGLTGYYEVRGLYELRYVGKELTQVHAPLTLLLKPTTAPLAVLDAAARIHHEKFGGGDHHFVEAFAVGEGVLTLIMGS